MRDERLRFRTGDTLTVRAHTSKPGEGLTYPAGAYIALEEGFSDGWDVWGVRNAEGKEVFIYGFSVEGVR